jgi:hypothetical protein
VELHIEPEPTPEERAAIEQALAVAPSGRGEHARSAWWRAGLEEALSTEPGRDARNGAERGRP